MARRPARRAGAGLHPYGSDPIDLGPAGDPTPAWSARLIANGGPDVPEYGSDAWNALDDNDPRRVAATVAAAEAWRHANDPAVLADRLHLELAAGRHAAALEAEAAAELARRAVAEPVADRAGRPTLAELAVEREDWPALARARAQAARVDQGLTGLSDASRAVHRRRAHEATRSPSVPSPLQGVGR